MGDLRRRKPTEAVTTGPESSPVAPGSPDFLRLGTMQEAMASRGESAPQFVYQGILNGYRLHNLTITQALKSLFRWHNETMNVWTHIAGFILFIFLIAYTAMHNGGTGGAMIRPLAACTQAPERIACVRNLTLATLSREELLSASSLLGVASSSRMLDVMVTEAGRAFNASASSAGDLRRAVAHQLAGLRVPTVNLTLPSWLPRPAGSADEGAPRAPPKCTARGPDGSWTPAGCLPPGRLAKVAARIRQSLMPQRVAPVVANLTSANLLSLAAGGLENLTHSASASIHDVTHRLTHLQLSALLASLPKLPELAALQGEAERVLASMAEALSEAHILPRGVAHLERWPIYCFLASGMVCLLGSAVYHLFGTANTRWTSTLGTLDFVGITALIVGSFIPVLYYGFHSHLLYRNSYISFISVLGCTVLGLSMTSLFHDERYRVLRTSLFILLGMSGVIPVTHLMVHHQFNELAWSVVLGTMLTGASYLIGAAFYLARFPEVLAPGRFDFILSSHNIWHVFVIIGGCVHYMFVLDLWAGMAVPSGDPNVNLVVVREA